MVLGKNKILGYFSFWLCLRYSNAMSIDYFSRGSGCAYAVQILRLQCNHSTKSVTVLSNHLLGAANPNARPGKQRILLVFTAREGVEQTWYQVLRQVSHALNPAMGRVRTPHYTRMTGTSHYVTAYIVTLFSFRALWFGVCQITLVFLICNKITQKKSLLDLFPLSFAYIIRHILDSYTDISRQMELYCYFSICHVQISYLCIIVLTKHIQCVKYRHKNKKIVNGYFKSGSL